MPLPVCCLPGREPGQEPIAEGGGFDWEMPQRFRCGIDEIDAGLMFRLIFARMEMHHKSEGDHRGTHTISAKRGFLNHRMNVRQKLEILADAAKYDASRKLHVRVKQALPYLIAGDHLPALRKAMEEASPAAQLDLFAPVSAMTGRCR